MAAFQASARQRQQLLRISRNSSCLDDDAATRTSQIQALFTPDTEEWIVFSPSVAGGTNTILSGTGTRSDLESIIATPTSQRTRHEAVFENDGEEEEEEESLDGAETDSLQAFRDQEDQAVLFPTLPTHDGLGTFASSSGITGFRSLEESLRLAAASERGSEGDDTHSRIMKWRMEQGHALMDEIEKATRRRRRLSIIGRRNIRPERASSEGERDKEAAIPETDGEMHSEDEEDDTNETFWKRITRSFIRDIIGIDDDLLEVLFGEALPTEAQLDSSSEDAHLRRDTEERILNRIAKELGELVHLYTHHPAGTGAFSKAPEETDSEEDDSEEDGAKTPQPRTTHESTVPRAGRPRGSSLVSTVTGTSSVPQFQFSPTLALRQEEMHHASLWGIEETDELKNTQLRREYWEQELDMRLVFSYLKSRFCGLPGRPPTTTSSSAATTSTSSSAPWHHHHPLINGKHSYYNRKSTTIAPSTTATAAAPPAPAAGGFFGNFFMENLRMGGNWNDRVAKDRRGSKASSRSRGGYSWGVATSVGSGQSSCVGTGVWAAI